MSQAYEDVKYRVSTLLPLYLEKESSGELYDKYLRSFWVDVLTATDLFHAVEKVKLHKKVFINNNSSHSKTFRVVNKAFSDMMEILKSTKKYYGVGLEILFKHDLVLQ